MVVTIVKFSTLTNHNSCHCNQTHHRPIKHQSRMYAYGMDLSLLDFTLSGEILQTLDHHLPQHQPPSSPPPYSLAPPRHHRHDGTSPLPLGMDWSPPPRKWDGFDTVWPHDPRTGWSYCVTVPSWTILPSSGGSGPIVSYRVQVGIQTPEAISTTRGVLRRFSDFLNLYSELKKLFLKKSLPVPPPRKLLGTKSKRVIEERRFSLDNWMEKLLSDIDISRSAPVAMFLELEAAARLSFHNTLGNSVSKLSEHQLSSDTSMIANGSSVASDNDDETGCEKSKIVTPRHVVPGVPELLQDGSSSDIVSTSGAYSSIFSGGTESDKLVESTFRAISYGEDGKDILIDGEDEKVTAPATILSTDSEVNSLGEIANWKKSSVYDDGILNFPEGTERPAADEATQFRGDFIVALPSEQGHKLSRVLVTMQERLVAAKADMEDLVARLDQELAVRQYLTTKVKDLELELETTKDNTKENLQHAISIEKEKSTQAQWDLEEFRNKCLEMELKLNAEQDEKAQIESEKMAVIQENEMLMRELDSAREQLQNLQKQNEEAEMKSKTDVKVLVKEVKSLRSSQIEMKQELGQVLKEKLEVEELLKKEKQRREHATSVNKKLLHECAILQERLVECSVSFKVEAEDRIVVDAASQSDALDLLNMSDNRIGLLLAEAQLLAQDVERSVIQGDRTAEDDMRKMLTDVFIDSANARKQMNSAIRCALDERETGDEGEGEGEEPPVRDTVLGNLL